MSHRAAAEAFCPGEYIQDELSARGWTQDDLAQILGRPLNAVNQIIKGKRAITPETARGLAAAFDTSAELWMNLESAFRLSKAGGDDDGEVSRRAMLYSVAPVSEMIRRGWIEPGDGAKLAGQLQQFFRTRDLTRIPALPMVARKSTAYGAVSLAERAWAYRAYRLAQGVQASPFQASKFIQQLPRIARMTEPPEAVRMLPGALASLGVRLVLVAHLEKTRLDGAALWLNEKSPVVALSLRFDRIDYFYHTLLHELVHVKNRDAAIDSNLVPDAMGVGGDDSTNHRESRTNAEAASLLVPQDKLKVFVAQTSPYYSRQKVVRFAQAIGVHPGIVVGQLHHRHITRGDGIPPKNLRDLLVPVRSLIVGQTMTDGWGHCPGVR